MPHELNAALHDQRHNNGVRCIEMAHNVCRWKLVRACNPQEVTTSYQHHLAGSLPLAVEAEPKTVELVQAVTTAD